MFDTKNAFIETYKEEHVLHQKLVDKQILLEDEVDSLEYGTQLKSDVLGRKSVIADRLGNYDDFLAARRLREAHE